MSAGSGGVGGGNSVVSLVAQLKAGQLTKEELFDQLSKIQKAKRLGGQGAAWGQDTATASRGIGGLRSPDPSGDSAEGAGADRRSGGVGGLGATPQAAQLLRDEAELLQRAKLQYGTHQHRPASATGGTQLGGTQFSEGLRGRGGAILALQQPEDTLMNDDDFDREPEVDVYQMDPGTYCQKYSIVAFLVKLLYHLPLRLM